jgi:hypothetical protein
MKTIKQHSGRIEVKPALAVIQGWRNAYAAAFKSACEHDGIDPDSKFVVFSEFNPYVVFVNNAHKMLNEAIREYRAGGYVGLQMN